MTWIPAAISAVGGIGQSILGGRAQTQTNNQNMLISMMNMMQQQQAQREQLGFAREVQAEDRRDKDWYKGEQSRLEAKSDSQRDKQERESKLGSADALGNRVYFDPLRGWVSKLSDQQQGLYDYFIQQELPMMRDQFSRSDEQSRTNADMANALLQQFKNVQRQDPREIEALLFEEQTRGQNEALDALGEGAIRGALRSGNSNLESILAGLSRTGAAQRANARTQARLQAEGNAEQRYMGEREGLAKLYQMFLGDSQQPLQPSYNPGAIGSGLAGQMGQAQQVAGQRPGQYVPNLNLPQGQGNTMVFNSMGKAPQLNYQASPDLGAAGNWGAVFGNIGGALNKINGNNQRDQTLNQLQSYFSAGGSTDFNNGGVVNNLGNRVQQNRDSNTKYGWY